MIFVYWLPKYVGKRQEGKNMKLMVILDVETKSGRIISGCENNINNTRDVGKKRNIKK